MKFREWVRHGCRRKIVSGVDQRDHPAARAEKEKPAHHAPASSRTDSWSYGDFGSSSTGAGAHSYAEKTVTDGALRMPAMTIPIGSSLVFFSLAFMCRLRGGMERRR